MPPTQVGFGLMKKPQSIALHGSCYLLIKGELKKPYCFCAFTLVSDFTSTLPSAFIPSAFSLVAVAEDFTFVFVSPLFSFILATVPLAVVFTPTAFVVAVVEACVALLTFTLFCTDALAVLITPRFTCANDTVAAKEPAGTNRVYLIVFLCSKGFNRLLVYGILCQTHQLPRTTIVLYLRKLNRVRIAFIFST